MKNLIILIFCLSFLNVLSQPQYVDSLRREYKLTKDKHAKIDIFYEIATELSLDNPAVGFLYSDSILLMSKESKYKKGMAMSYHLRGFAHDDKGEYEQAMIFFQDELAIFTELQDRKEQSTAYNNIANVWRNLGNSDSSIVYYLKSLTIDEELNNMFGASIIHNNVGNIYSDDGAYEKAIEHFEKALKIRQDLGEEKRYLQCYSSLAIVCSRMKDFEKSLEYSKMGLANALKYDNKAYAGIITNSLGSSYNEQEKFGEAITWLEQAMNYWQQIGNEVYQTYALYNLTISHAGLGLGDKALEFANQGFEIVQRLKLDYQHELYYKAYALAYESAKKPQQALDWYKKYVAVADSIFQSEKTENIARIEAQFEFQKKEAQLAKQQLQLERQTTQKKIILLSSIILIFILILGLFYIRTRQKIRQNEANLEAKLRNAETEKLKELDVIKSNFFASISHEFRTPLTLILSPIEQMMGSTDLGTNKKYFSIIQRNAKRLLDLVNQLLDLSKIESGKLDLEISEGNLSRFVNAIAGSFESLAEKRNIKFYISVPNENWSSFFDRDKLEKILVNLISNAFKFTEEGDSIFVELEVSTETATISIRDTGIGIKPENLPKLFDRFTKSNPSDLQLGSGLGLSLSRELALLHKGNIKVESEIGQGSVFILSLCVKQEGFENKDFKIDVDSNLSLSSTQVISDPTNNEVFKERKQSFSDLVTSKSKPVVLVAEDNEDLRFYIADILSSKFQIIEAKNGKEALEIAIQNAPDLIITDVVMPEMDGITLCKLLKSNEKTSHVPVIILTARSEQPDKLEGLETGAEDYLVKPFDSQELLVRSSNLIDQRLKLQEHFRSTLTSFASPEINIEDADVLFLKKINKEVLNNLEDENFSVLELSHKINMSRSQLHRKLSSLTGYSPNEVIRNMRLERAKQLIISNSANVSEVAYMCGFNSPAYFIKCYKDYFGNTPGQTI